MTSSGALMGLVAYGKQDEWHNQLPPNRFDAKKCLLKDVHHQRIYMKVDCNVATKETQSGIAYTFEMKKVCDLLNNVDLYIHNFGSAGTGSVNDLIKRIEVVVHGHQRIDRIENDIETIINTNAELFRSNRKIRLFGDTLIVPLHVAPFHDCNLVSPSLEYHRLEVNIVCTRKLDMELYADCYYIDNPHRRRILYDERQEFVTVQHQSYWNRDPGVVRHGKNTFRLNFTHPVHCIYFWGFDKTKVRRITLNLNDLKNPDYPHLSENPPIYYDGDITPLEYYKMGKGITAEPIMIFFSDMDMYNRPQSTVNFTRLDNPVLTIETDQEEETPLNLVGLNIHAFHTSCGMMGMRYVK